MKFDNNDTAMPATFTYNFVDEIESTDNGEVIISEDGKAALLEENGWIQILNTEGYVTQGFNEPDIRCETLFTHRDYT